MSQGRISSSRYLMESGKTLRTRASPWWTSLLVQCGDHANQSGLKGHDYVLTDSTSDGVKWNVCLRAAITFWRLTEIAIFECGILQVGVPGRLTSWNLHFWLCKKQGTPYIIILFLTPCEVWIFVLDIRPVLLFWLRWLFILFFRLVVMKPMLYLR